VIGLGFDSEERNMGPIRSLAEERERKNREDKRGGVSRANRERQSE
jgi:hypothetical protein